MTPAKYVEEENPRNNLSLFITSTGTRLYTHPRLYIHEATHQQPSSYEPLYCLYLYVTGGFMDEFKCKCSHNLFRAYRKKCDL